MLLSAREREPGRRRAISAEENKALVRREQQELWNHTGELHAADEFFAADQAELPRAPASTFFRRDFPDVLSTIEDIIAEGDKVVARFRSRATRGSIWALLPAARRCNSRASPFTT